MAWGGARATYAAIAAQQAASGYGCDLHSGLQTPTSAPTGILDPVPIMPPGPVVPVGPMTGVAFPSSQLGRFVLGLSLLGASRPPATAAFSRDAGVLPGTLDKQTGFVPPLTGDRLGHAPSAIGAPGGFAIGRGAIGHRRPLHGVVTLGVPPGVGNPGQK